MRLALLVTLAAVLAGCGMRVHYTYRGYAYGYGYYHQTTYSTSYGSTNIQWNQATPPPPPAPLPATGEIEVSGSDGSYGWQRTCNADVEIHRLSEQMAHKGCEFESYGYDETKAICGGLHVILRRDATHVYRLCPPNTDRAACQAAWAPVIAP